MSCPCPREPDAPGTVFLVVGPSGVGKDTLINGAKMELAACPRIHFARRVITRPPSPDTEDYESVTPERFAALRERGALALHWSAHGLDYGIPAAALDPLGAGEIAVLNGSRGVIDAARAAFPRFHVVHVTAPAEVLARRLAARGRESAAEIAERLTRVPPRPVTGADVITIVNDGSREAGIEQFLCALHTAAPGCRVLTPLTRRRLNERS